MQRNWQPNLKQQQQPQLLFPNPQHAFVTELPRLYKWYMSNAITMPSKPSHFVCSHNGGMHTKSPAGRNLSLSALVGLTQDISTLWLRSMIALVSSPLLKVNT